VLAFNHLASQVHPLALGNVKRSLSQSKMMATKLLSLHLGMDENHKIKEIVDNLTSKLYYHGHPINRKEAKEQVGLEKVIEPAEDLERDIWSLYLDYEQEMLLESPFDPLQELLAANQGAVPGQITAGEQVAKLVSIESETREDYLEFKYRINGVLNPDGTTNAQTIQLGRTWKTL
jgi:ribonucleotide reductase alpha subunit